MSLEQKGNACREKYIILVCVAAAIACLNLAACNKIEDYVGDLVEKKIAAATTLEKKVLEQRVSELETEVNQLSSRTADMALWQEIWQQTDFEVRRASAEVSSEQGGYGISRNKHGTVLVSVEKIYPYLDGYKAILSIGNMTSASFHGAVVEVHWGLPRNTRNKTYKEIMDTQKEKKFEVTKYFSPGAYTEVEISLTPAHPEEVKLINVYVDWNRLSMRKPSQ